MALSTGTVVPEVVANVTVVAPFRQTNWPGLIICRLTCVTAAPGGSEYGLALVASPAHFSMVIIVSFRNQSCQPAAGFSSHRRSRFACSCQTAAPAGQTPWLVGDHAGTADTFLRRCCCGCERASTRNRKASRCACALEGRSD